jgi:hypothetical protein
MKIDQLALAEYKSERPKVYKSFTNKRNISIL